MIHVENSAIIGRPVEDVWAFVSDVRNEPRWHTDIINIRSASEPADAPASWVLGAVWLVTVQFMGRREYEVEITGLEETRLIEMTTRTGPVRPKATYLFEPANEGTRFTRRVDLPLRGLLRVLGPMMRRDVRNRNARFVSNLRRLLE